MVECIQISLKSFESELIQRASSEILEMIPSEWKYSQFSFPRKIKKFTVLRSPHIDKKSREQFQIEYYKNIIRLEKNNDSKDNLEESFNIFLENLKQSKFYGIQMKIEFNYSTFLHKK